MPYHLFKRNLNPKDLKRHKIATQSCFNKLFKVTQKLHENTQADQEILQIDDEPSFESARHIANQFLELLDCSPIKTVRTDRTVSLGKRKISDITAKFSQTVAVALDEPTLAISANKDCDNCDKRISDTHTQ